MSKFVQKTLHSLNTVFNNSGMFYSERDKLLNTWGLDQSSFVSKLKKAESKKEEEEIINQLFAKMKKRLSEPDLSNAEVEEMVKMCMVCETLEYNSDFIYVHALKLAQKGNTQQKHTGYLAADYFLNPDHELVILLINTMQKDLKSSNYVEVILALTSICHLISADTVNNVLHLVEDKLEHQIPSVRKIAVLTLSHCLQLIDSESSYQLSFQKLEKRLSDPELEVVSVVVPTIYKLIQKLPGDFSYLLDSLIQLLEQILMRRIPHSMNYSDIPAPWLQIEILKLIKYLYKNDMYSEKLNPVLKKTLAQTGVSHPIAQAITYQVVETIACIEADADLLEVAMSSVSLLLKSKDVNFKLMGLEALVLLMKKIKPNITGSQQDIIIDCLKLPDETLQLKTLDLMYQLANPSNVQAICKKMLEFLDQVKENEKKKDLALKILQLSEKFLDRQEWYISVVNTVLMKMGDVIETTAITQIIETIAKNESLKNLAKESYVKLLQSEEYLSSSLIKIFVSVLSTPSEFEMALLLLHNANEDAVCWLLILLTESVLKFRTVSPKLTDSLKALTEKYENSFQVEIILKQLLCIIDNMSILSSYDPDTKIDPSLSFLDGFVLEALENSGTFYEPCSLRATRYFTPDKAVPDNTSDNTSFPPSEEVVQQNLGSSFILKSPTYSAFSSPSLSSLSFSSEKDLPSPPEKRALWTKEGRIGTNSLKNEADDLEKDEELKELFAGIN